MCSPDNRRGVTGPRRALPGPPGAGRAGCRRGRRPPPDHSGQPGFCLNWHFCCTLTKSRGLWGASWGPESPDRDSRCWQAEEAAHPVPGQKQNQPTGASPAPASCTRAPGSRDTREGLSAPSEPPKPACQGALPNLTPSSDTAAKLRPPARGQEGPLGQAPPRLPTPLEGTAT